MLIHFLTWLLHHQGSGITKQKFAKKWCMYIYMDWIIDVYKCNTHLVLSLWIYTIYKYCSRFSKFDSMVLNYEKKRNPLYPCSLNILLVLCSLSVNFVHIVGRYLNIFSCDYFALWHPRIFINFHFVFCCFTCFI